MDPKSRPQGSSRRRFLAEAAGIGVVAGVAHAGCSPTAAAPDAGEAPLPSYPLLDVTGAKLPYRQDDPAWGSDLMWDRDLVIRAAHELNGASLADARALLRAFDDGNSIGNEGCQLTCFAMILRLFAPDAAPAWTPKTLNDAAHELTYYSACGLSMSTLYADLVAEVTAGEVQLCLKEEYLPGEPGWPRVFPQTSALVRAYRSLPPATRTHFLVMLKTGTYDDTVASHYVLLDPNDAGAPDAADAVILDPAMPAGETKRWHLSDSAAAITQDPDIAAAWKDAGIEPTQIGGVWVFGRAPVTGDRTFLAPLVRAWARELAGA